MKLVSFRVQTSVGTFVRVGTLHGQSLIDLNMAYARLLANQREAQPYRLANVVVPAAMLGLLEGGSSSMAAARQAFDYAVKLGKSVRGPEGETVVYPYDFARPPDGVRVIAPLPNPPSLRDFLAFEDNPSRPSGTKRRFITKATTARSSGRMRSCRGRWRPRSWTMSLSWPASSAAKVGTSQSAMPRTISPAIRS